MDHNFICKLGRYISSLRYNSVRDSEEEIMKWSHVRAVIPKHRAVAPFLEFRSVYMLFLCWFYHND